MKRAVSGRRSERAVSDSICITLVITSRSLSPAEIEARLGFQVDEHREKGRIYGRSRTAWKENTCVVRVRQEGSFDEHDAGVKLLSNNLEKLFRRVRGASPAIRAFSDDEGVWIRVFVSARYAPAFILSPKHVADIAELGAWLEYDLMIYSDDED